MRSPFFTPARPAHCRELARTLKWADRREVFRATGKRPLPALLEGVQNADEAIAAVMDSRTVAIFGITPLNIVAGIGTPWFLSAPMRHTEVKALLRHAPWWIRRWHVRYPVLIQAIDQEHSESLRLVSYLGFKITDSGTRGWVRGKYHLVQRRLDDKAVEPGESRCATQQ